MQIVWFILFFTVSYGILIVMFNWTTYHAYFWPLSPVLIGYACLVGYLLYFFGLHGGFLWYIGLSLVLASGIGKKIDISGKKMMRMTDDADVLRLTAESVANTKKYFWMTVVFYLVFFSVAYLTVLNVNLKGT